MIVDSDKHPELNIYFIGAIILKVINKSFNCENDILDIFKKYNKGRKIKVSFDYFLLGMDWLYILGIININEKGNVILCI
ncbi:ABC-three component system middle component 6 [Legionella spiritensis]|uniref:Uncharacterized protein n=1 Tax=Legionella spiritensis TaxID=452 RepID=A0A0W0Z8C1_LEGSP|nr:ABC-three component system middle component 6 [Legionella spiritensis]KTD65345.1 hypothetical protein Lspi_0662 [Legionella spiritensis]SNV47378.1 Uncharacterised protein [Legionella spiritensis]